MMEISKNTFKKINLVNSLYQTNKKKKKKKKKYASNQARTLRPPKRA